MKEWLNTKTYEYKQAACMFGHSEWIEIPKGAEMLSNDGGPGLIFWKDGFSFVVGYDDKWSESTMKFHEFRKSCTNSKILWKRPAQPEALPFIDDEPQSLNDQYAEIEQVRQSAKDNVNHPNHYTKGKVECIDAIESATIGKKGIDAVCVANVIKYLWRYEEKNGLEDIKKAQWYLQKLIENTML